jgi:hypothetical protein
MLCFLPASQESTSLKVLHMVSPFQGEPSSLAFESMVADAQSLQPLSRICPNWFKWHTRRMGCGCSLGEHPSTGVYTGSFRGYHCLPQIDLSARPSSPRMHGYAIHLTGLETWSLGDTSKTTEPDINGLNAEPMTGLTHALQALARRPTLTK